HVAGRDPESDQRAHGRDGDRRAAADHPRAGRAVHRAPARAAGGQAGPHRLGAGERARGTALVRADRTRPLVHRAPQLAPGPADPAADGADGARWPRALQGRHRRLEGPSRVTAVLLTGVGKRYDIVASFAQHTTVVAADPNPLAPAQYAATVRASVPLISDPDYVPALQRLCDEHGVGAIVPLTDLDIETLAQARADGRLPQALVPDPQIASATYDKYEAHLLLER